MIYRLDKYISEGLALSRQDAKKYISQGRVYINGERAKKGDAKINRDTDMVICDGRQVVWEEYVYIMLNKPQGIVSASEDKNDVTVVDLVKNDFPKRNLFPAGRLDKTSTGLVLITDDGKFAHDILSPKHHVDKTYIITVDSPVTQQVVTAFTQGVTLADGQQLEPATIIPSPDGLSATVVLHQGVYHQIKRMLGVYGIGVNTLHRVAIGGLELPADLQSGQYVKLTPEQISQIKQAKFTLL